MNSNTAIPRPFSLTSVPFDFFPATSADDRKIHNWKSAEASKNNAALLARSAAEANAKRFAQ